MQSLPLYSSLGPAAEAVQECRACARGETRQIAVFGHGNPDARLMLVGEAPSSTDDDTGKPFTGPAGRLLDDLLREAGIHRRDIWITNLIRCFAGRMRNGRIENRPAAAREIAACATWLDVELRLVDPAVILAVGAPAAKALIGRDFRLQEQRGQVIERPDGRLVIATIQPAYVMRLTSIIDRDASDAARADLAADIRQAVELAGITR